MARTARSVGLGSYVPQQRVIRNATLVAVFALGIWAEASEFVDAVVRYWGDVLYLGKQHLVLVGISWGLAALTAIPLGIWLSRPSMRRVSETIMQGLNIGATVPTLAVLALAMTFLGIGFWPSIFGLWLFTLMPIVRNVYTGILAVPSYLHEAARGMGMTRRQILFRVELPNAMFVIFAGLRTALAINVGSVPLVFLIGGGGLGELIFTGIALMRTQMMLVGAISTALLAVVLDFLISQLQFWLVPKGVNPLRGNR